MAKNTKRGSLSLVIGGMQMKRAVTHHFTSNRLAKRKKSLNVGKGGGAGGKDVAPSGPSLTIDGEVNSYHRFGVEFGVEYLIKLKVLIFTIQ